MLLKIVNYIMITTLLEQLKKSHRKQWKHILIAPTGSGKTEASLLWADYNQNEEFFKKIFYLLPYTASINAMYNRLVKDLGNEELVGLLMEKHLILFINL